MVCVITVKDAVAECTPSVAVNMLVIGRALGGICWVILKLPVGPAWVELTWNDVPLAGTKVIPTVALGVKPDPCSDTSCRGTSFVLGTTTRGGTGTDVLVLVAVGGGVPVLVAVGGGVAVLVPITEKASGVATFPELSVAVNCPAPAGAPLDTVTVPVTAPVLSEVVVVVATVAPSVKVIVTVAPGAKPLPCTVTGVVAPAVADVGLGVRVGATMA